MNNLEFCNIFITFAVRKIIKSEEYDAFYASLQEKVQEKLDYILNILIQHKVVNTKFVKKLKNTDYYELRISVDCEYRVLLFSIDQENIIEASQVVILNGFIKKSTKDYKKQLAIAASILKSITV